MPAETICPRCSETLSIMLPPSDSDDQAKCDKCDRRYWRDSEGKRHMPPIELAKGPR